MADQNPSTTPDTAEPADEYAEAAAAADDGSARPSIDLIAFLQSLYLNALMNLGEVETPDTKRRETNLDLARQNIDIINVLREKTAGNLTPEENAFLEEILPQLKLLYVRKAG